MRKTFHFVMFAKLNSRILRQDGKWRVQRQWQSQMTGRLGLRLRASWECTSAYLAGLRVCERSGDATFSKRCKTYDG
ncbi:MAG TPA: hypothetical protein VGF59_08315, partial [Bryobacteraceae bacterium]